MLQLVRNLHLVFLCNEMFLYDAAVNLNISAQMCTTIFLHYCYEVSDLISKVCMDKP